MTAFMQNIASVIDILVIASVWQEWKDEFWLQLKWIEATFELKPTLGER